MELTKEKFTADILKHQLVIKKNDGLYRHLRVADPTTFCMGYEIVTWPGSLAYTGDMGTFFFERTEDMFRFFGSDRINPGYWAEKLQAVDKCDGLKKYSPEAARQYINEQLDAYKAEQGVRDAAAEIATDDGEDTFRRDLRDFAAHPTIFDDAWESDVTEYTHRYMWCCYAITHAIKLFNEATATKATP